MLCHLSIRNLAIIEQLELDLKPGLTTLTGETGAGKSIIIDALNLTLGERVDTSLIRQQQQRCQVTAVFDIQDNQAAQHWLHQHDLDESQCMLRRQLNRNGNNRCYINDTPVNQRLMQDLAKLLVNIHSQHAQQQLSNTHTATRILDEFGNHQALLAELNQLAEHYQQLQQTQSEILAQQGDTHRLELLQYQLAELSEFSPSENEYQQLNELHHQLANQEALQASLNQALQNLSDSDHSVLNQIHASLNQLQQHASSQSKLQSICQMLIEAQALLQESAHDLNQFNPSEPVDEHQFADIDDRLSQWHQLARKHRIDATQLYPHYQQLQHQLSELSNAQQRLSDIKHQLQTLFQQWQPLAQQLSQSRQQASLQLSLKTNQHLKQLAITQGRFIVQVSPEELQQPQPNGLDKVAFLFTAYQNLEPLPLHKIASGGELSRVSLALMSNLAQSNLTTCLIFDEVDVGVGGKTASLIGTKLQHLSQQQQVIAITHQAQVAAHAHQHLRVSKTPQAKILIDYLETSQRIAELARMIGGLSITQTTQKHAMELLQQAHQSQA